MNACGLWTYLSLSFLIFQPLAVAGGDMTCPFCPTLQIHPRRRSAQDHAEGAPTGVGLARRVGGLDHGGEEARGANGSVDL